MSGILFILLKKSIPGTKIRLLILFGKKDYYYYFLAPQQLLGVSLVGNKMKERKTVYLVEYSLTLEQNVMNVFLHTTS